MGKDPVTEGRFYKGEQVAQQALRFASSQGLEVLHYDPVADTWQLSDGEIYTSAAVMRYSLS